MRVLLVYPNMRKESLVPPSVALLSRILKNEGVVVGLFDSTDYEIDLNSVDADRVKRVNLQVIPYESIERYSKGNVLEEFQRMVSEFSPDLIAVTSTESTFLLGTTLLSALRGKRPPVVLGGVFATFAPHICLRYPEIDMLIVGEGEHALVALCRALASGAELSSVPGLWTKDLDGSPRPSSRPAPLADINENPTELDVSLFDEHRLYRPMAGNMFRMLSVETHRGCPYSCGYCNSPGQNDLFGARAFFRKKSAEKVRQEILFYKERYRIEYVFFWADTFFAFSPKEFDEFIEMYRDIRLPFWVQTRPETVVAPASAHRLRQMKDIGLHFISYGLEHGNERFRAEVIGRKMDNDLLVRAFRATADAGVPFNVNNIIGFPDETRDLVFDTIRLNREFEAHSMSCSIFMPYHGTELHRLSVRRGFISGDTICPSNNDRAIMNMSTMSCEEITALARTFPLYVRFPEERWNDIRRAEEETPEGQRILAELREEFRSTYIRTVPVPLYSK